MNRDRFHQRFTSSIFACRSQNKIKRYWWWLLHFWDLLEFKLHINYASEIDHRSPSRGTGMRPVGWETLTIILSIFPVLIITVLILQPEPEESVEKKNAFNIIEEKWVLSLKEKSIPPFCSLFEQRPLPSLCLKLPSTKLAWIKSV